jgi:hypothetical protein
MRAFRDALLVATGVAVGAGALNAGVEWLADLHWSTAVRPVGVLVLVGLLGLWWALPRIGEQRGR